MESRKPNIFSIATKELSQDGFFTWLIQWADNSNREFDPLLCDTAQEFVKTLIQKQHDTSNLKIETVKTWRQWEKIDIIAEINDEYAIIIEDKTNTGEHSEQLERYRQSAINHYKDKKHKLVFIYLKTGNESISSLKKVEEKEFAVFDRRSILEIFNKNEQTRNEIYIEFKEYMTHIESKTNSFAVFENITSDWYAGEGFYISLQERLQEQSDWRYVANQMGGFLGFWYHWNSNDIFSIYIQIENAFDYGIKLVIKIGDWEPNTNALYEILTDLQEISKQHGLTLVKPDRYRAGETSTVAIVKNDFPVDKDGLLDMEQLMTNLKTLENIIDKYCKKGKNTPR